MNLRGAPILDAGGRPVGRRDPVELGPTQDLAVYAVDMTVDRRRATPDELARLAGQAAAADPRLRRSDGMAVMRPARPKEDLVTTPATAPALPCDDCLHAVVCGLKALLPTDPRGDLDELSPGLRVRFTAAVECDHQLPHARGGPMPPGPTPSVVMTEAIAAARRDPAAHQAQSRRNGTARSIAARAAKRDRKGPRYPLPTDRAERDRVVLEAVRATTSAAEAGALLGVSDGRIGQVLREIREAGELPADIAAAIAARKSRGRLAVGAAEPGDPS